VDYGFIIKEEREGGEKEVSKDKEERWRTEEKNYGNLIKEGRGKLM